MKKFLVDGQRSKRDKLMHDTEYNGARNHRAKINEKGALGKKSRGMEKMRLERRLSSQWKPWSLI